MAERRDLSFTSLNEVMPDVERLIPGYKTVGNWSLGQICYHLALAVRCSIDGYSENAPWIVRKTIGPFAFRSVMKSGRMGTGIKVPAAFLPIPGLEDLAQVNSLRSCLARYQAHTGPLAPHPFFGDISAADWTRLHCIHCAHHLSFALPSANG
ncbi:MAG TPA: DUF1569 domain-containing protein [Isosphaeraceae bacterium]|jgi:hypothetical protein|nr:DUF1569 domain-containing protein [Isosphaeraceae bacterium]